MTNDVPSITPPSLRQSLEAQGAKRHRRMGDLGRFLLQHYDEVLALRAEDGYGWADIAAMLARVHGLSGANGKPLTAHIVKLTWLRVRQRRQRRADTPALAPARLGGVVSSSSHSVEYLGEPGFDLVIRPASLPGTAPVSPETVQDQRPALLSDEEVQRRIDALAGEQGKQRVPLPKVL